MAKDEAYEEPPKGNRRDDKQINGCNLLPVIAKERLPALQRPALSRQHVDRNRGPRDIDAQFEQLAVDPGSAPQRVGEAHVADQLVDFEWHFRSAYSRARLPSPEQAKPGPVPADNRLRLDDHQGVQNVGCNPIEARKNETIKIVEDDPLRHFSLQHIELVAKHQDLRLKRGSRPDVPGE